TSAGVTSIMPVTPAEGSEMRSDSLRFSWRAVDNVSTYKLIVTDSVGTPLLGLTTRDTTVGPTTIGGVREGERYLWYVDALRLDGTSMSGPQTSFRIRSR